ncbi:LexA family protein [Marinospirillum insulare]|uniref:Peptidase S24/S26A/S26B/S26C domain-containing protein n=1 Tax=Marinospirillum insulare TaxID=217169 RepID=A0ABQ5ZXN1_9GAMM|nr:S24 family peptidase [Marinospirillum insulare]GLR63777.1 hypothetical protein GCM10007878_12120 [Marinospirillum insulare]
MDINQTFTALTQKTSSELSETSEMTGFLSPAAGAETSSLSLDKYLAPRPSSTYYCRVVGDAMQNAGINDGDLLVVDSSLNPTHNRVVVAVLFGEMIVRRLVINNSGSWLIAESSNSIYQPVNISRYDHETLFWGVVTWTLHQP